MTTACPSATRLPYKLLFICLAVERRWVAHANTSYLKGVLFALSIFGCKNARFASDGKSPFRRHTKMINNGVTSVLHRKWKSPIRIGTAGWNIPKDLRTTFNDAGTHLQRYGNKFNAVEINSSFYRPHRVQTYARWAASVPAELLFSVKAPKEITHEMRLLRCAVRIDQFVQEIAGLGSKLGCVLVQLPPSLQFEREVASAFFATFREVFEGPIVCEPRHVTWFAEEAEDVLADHRVGRVAADPPMHAKSVLPGGCSEIQYFRLHGSPKTYYSPYSSCYLSNLGNILTSLDGQRAAVWCVFDNTAEGHATANALELLRLLSKQADK